MEKKVPDWLLVTFIYTTPLLIFLCIYGFKRRKTHIKSSLHLTESVNEGMTEAPSLHPVINPLLCIGCNSCVSACPEKNVLGLIHQQAKLITPANCIGHGACKNACPEKAITLVFGSATRGVDIPDVSSKFESNIKGIYIAGELGGMGLIRNAIEQGRQAIESVAEYLKHNKSEQSDILDCIIVGSGPAGLSATLGAKAVKINSITIDQDKTAGTIRHFPKGKLVMTQEAHLPLVGKVKWGEISKENLLDIWFKLIDEYKIKVQQQEMLLSVTELESGGFEVKTSKNSYLTQTVLLALGRRGTPRKLNVEGEDLPKVVYRLTDPDQYRDKSVLVVGGGDSALEAACSIAELAGETKVLISYRKDSFNRAKTKNRQRVDNLVASGQLTCIFSSEVKSILPESVSIISNQKETVYPNQAVIICAGGVLPTGLLKAIGVSVTTKYGEVS